MAKKARLVLALFLLLMSVLIVACTSEPGGTAMTNPTIPILTEKTGWVIDAVDALSPDTEKVLEELAQEIAASNGAQLGVAVFNNANSKPVALATEFGNTNKLGSAEKDNGIAIVVLVQREGGDGHAPAIGVAIGNGLEGDLNDSKVCRMLDKTFVPLRAEGKWEDGLVSFVRSLIVVLKGEDGEMYAPEPINWVFWGIIIALIIILLILDFTLLDGAFTYAVLSSSSRGGSSRLGGGGSFGGGGVGR